MASLVVSRHQASDISKPRSASAWPIFGFAAIMAVWVAAYIGIALVGWQG